MGIAAGRSNLVFLPLVIDEDFKVPSQPRIQEYRKDCTVSSFERQPGEFATMLQTLFAEIAPAFLVRSSSEKVLVTGSQIIATRLMSAKRRRPLDPDTYSL